MMTDLFQPHLSVGLLGISLNSIVSAVFSGFTSWIMAGATGLLGALGHVISDSTNPPLEGGFSIELAVVARIGAALTAPFLGLAAISAIVQQDLGVLLRAVFIRLPLSLLLGGVAVELVSLAVDATNGLSNDVLNAAGPSVHSIIGGLATALVGLTAGGARIGAFGAAFLALMTVLIAFALWLELVVREAAISVAVLFLPIANGRGDLAGHRTLGEAPR